MAPRIGLVLGAGGVVGQAYHAGVLAALEHDLGWDPRTADVIVGSSAGSVTGSLLRLGVSASDLAAWAVEAPLSVEGAPMMEQLGGREVDPDFPAPSPLDLFRPWRLPPVPLLRRIAARPWAFRPTTSAMTMMPAGRIDIVEKAEVLHAISGDDWPDGLWICAARRRDGGRVVFGREGSPYAPLGRAVAASCAIPGYFAPVRIGNVSYFDGGVYSPTNADVLRDERLDLVVVLSPMSAAGGVARSADAPFRFLAHRKLQQEVGRLRSRGTPVVTFEPGARSVPVMGVNAMATDRADRVVQTAFLEAGRRAATGGAADRLRPLVSRPGRLRSSS